MIDTKALRQKILDMAIKGKLVPQDPNDEPASVLLERIRAEKQQLIKEGKIKKDKDDSVIFKGDDNRYYEKVGSEVKDITDDLPFEIPDSWVWIRLGYVVDFSQNDTVAANQIDPLSWVLDLEDIEKNSGKLLQKKTMDEIQSKSDKHRFYKGNVLYSKLRPYLNKVIVADDDGYCTTEILTFDFGQCIDARYAQIFLMSPHFVDYAMAGSYGVKMPRIGSHRGNSAFIPLPPYSEQKKIITQTKELFEQIEIIEQNQADIDTLYEEFKKRTLTLAIQGKLIPQDSNDEPASILLKRIRAEKKAKLGKKYVDSYIYKGDDNCYYEKVKDSTKEISDEIPFEIPENWRWIRIDNLFQHNTGKALNSSNTQGALHPYITTSNVYWGHFSLDRIKEMPFTEDEFAKCSIAPGDLLVCEGGDIGRAAIWEKDTPMCIQNHIHRLRTYYPVCTLFYYYAFFVYKSIGLIGGKGIGIQGLSSGSLGKLIFPLPPLAEQERIVKQVEVILEKLKDEV